MMFNKKSLPPNPVTRDEFRKFIATIVILGTIIFSLIFLLHQIRAITTALTIMLFYISGFGMLSALTGILFGRVRDIIGETTETSYFNIIAFEWFPLTNLMLLFYCLFKDSLNATLFEKRLFQEKRFGICLCLFFFTMQFAVMFGLGFGHLGKEFHTFSKWTATPSVHYITSVSYQARLVFDIKESVAAKGDVPAALEKIQKDTEFSNTGHTLSVAVIAVDVFKVRKKFARNPATAKTETLLLLLENLQKQERVYSVTKSPFHLLIPFTFMSGARLTEAALLLWIEDELNRQYLEIAQKRYSKMLTKVEADLKVSSMTTNYEKRISALRSQLNLNTWD